MMQTAKETQEIAVSIICNTYNQKEYIADALDGFLMQKTSFPFEVLVHDDASTDGTAGIVREYEKKFPEIIKPYYQEVNQYSQKKSIAPFQIPRAKGKYLAICEGDDYWTDPNKLQLQYDYMEANPQLDMCAHETTRISAVSGQQIGKVAPSEEDRVLTAEEVIAGGGAYLGTCSLFYRKTLWDNPPRFRQILKLDYTMQIQGALRGGIGYIAKPMAAYRIAAKGSWTRRMIKSPAAMLAHIEKMQEVLVVLDEDTQGKYADVIQEVAKKYRFTKAQYEKNWKAVRSKEFRKYYEEYSTKEKLAVFLSCKYPFVMRAWQRLKYRE